MAGVLGWAMYEGWLLDKKKRSAAAKKGAKTRKRNKKGRLV